MEILKSDKRFVLLLLLLALFTGLLYNAIAPSRPLSFDDAGSWDAVAKNVLNGKGFIDIDNNPTSVRPPTYPLFIALIYILFGMKLICIKLAQVVLNAFTICIVYLTAREIFNIRISKITGIALCLYPPLIVYTGIIGTETLFIFILSAVIYFIVTWFKRDSKYALLASGILLGILGLTRSTLLLYPVFLIASLFFVYTSKVLVKKITGLIIIGLISLAIILPWTYRNYAAFGKFLLVNTSSGELFWAGTYGPWDGICITNRDQHFFELFDIKKIKNPVVLEQMMAKAAINNIKDNPACFAKLTVKKFARFWFQPVGQKLVSAKSKLAGIFIYIIHALWLALAVIGFTKSKNERMLYLPITAMFIYFAVMHNLIAPIARYRLPLEPYIMLFAVYGIVFMIRQPRDSC